MRRIKIKGTMGQTGIVKFWVEELVLVVDHVM